MFEDINFSISRSLGNKNYIEAKLTLKCNWKWSITKSALWVTDSFYRLTHSIWTIQETTVVRVYVILHFDKGTWDPYFSNKTFKNCHKATNNLLVHRGMISLISTISFGRLTHFWDQCAHVTAGLSVQEVCLYVGCYLCFPPVSVVKQLLFIVQQLLMSLSGKLKVWTLRQ